MQRFFAIPWIFSILLSTTGVSMHSVYCYCTGKTAITFFVDKNPVQEVFEEKAVGSSCFKQEKKAEEKACCTSKKGKQPSEKACKDELPLIREALISYLPESNKTASAVCCSAEACLKHVGLPCKTTKTEFFQLKLDGQLQPSTDFQVYVLDLESDLAGTPEVLPIWFGLYVAPQPKGLPSEFGPPRPYGRSLLPRIQSWLC